MTTAVELLRQGRRDEIWKKYCGFIDLSLEEFMDIQRRLLMEQITLLSECELGRKVLEDRVPATVEEFREVVPLTTYDDYLPYLAEKREDVLPVKPKCWLRTSGRSGRVKWVPLPEEVGKKEVGAFLAGLIFATCQKRGDFVLEEHDKFLYCLAPPPYGSGMIPYFLLDIFPFDILPSVEEAEKMSFQERIANGFKLALAEGLDVFMGVPSVLVRIGEQFTQQSGGIKGISSLPDPKSLARLVRGLIHSKLAGRPMLPRDIWNLKGLMAGGTDARIYREKIEYYWGKRPLDIYGGVEMHVIAIQTWDYESMTFVPDSDFLEFIPQEEYLKSMEDPSYQPSTILLDEVEPGEVYELVVTNFGGGPFVRYRPQDLIRITALRNEKLGIEIPQMVFEGRCGDIIGLAGFPWLTEKVVWQAIVDAGIDDVGWTVRKEFEEGNPILHFYIELKEHERKNAQEAADAIHESLKNLNSDYRDMEEMLGLEPVRVSFLSPGTFERYYRASQAAGADLAWLKPPHMKPSDEIVSKLLRFSGQMQT